MKGSEKIQGLGGLFYLALGVYMVYSHQQPAWISVFAGFTGGALFQNSVMAFWRARD